MKKYGEFTLVDRIAKEYNYTHDQVFDLSWREAYTIIALGNERQYIESRAMALKQQSEST